MEFEEYLEATRNECSFRRRKSKETKAEFAAFQALLEKKVMEQVTEGVLEAFTEGHQDSDAHVYLNSEYMNPATFPCGEEDLKALQFLKKRIKLTVKMEILD